MPKNKAQTNTTVNLHQEYEKFLRSLELSWIALVESGFKCDRKNYLETEDPQLSLNWSCEPLRIEPKYFELSAGLQLTLTSDKSPTTLLELSGTFHLHIHTALITKKNVDRFADSEVRLVLWPYCREYVSNVCGRIHVPAIFLPLLGKGE